MALLLLEETRPLYQQQVAGCQPCLHLDAAEQTFKVVWRETVATEAARSALLLREAALYYRQSWWRPEPFRSPNHTAEVLSPAPSHLTFASAAPEASL